ncbi:MAG: hypothetical protein GY898_29240 [Proteobacteria bacterium]|nr:hypothetical protein [Pseudomonadota bacterium]
MKRICLVLAPIGAALVLAGCPPIDGVFDMSGLPDGEIDASYDGQLAIQDYSGPVSYTLISGELPEGLSFNEAGAVTGTPTAGADPVELVVLASDMRRVEEFQATVSFSIHAPDDADAFLGWDHDQVTNMTERFNYQGNPLQRDVWVRVAGSGIPEMWEYEINLGMYTAGDNDEPEQGEDHELRDNRFDDVRIGDIGFSAVEVDYSNWIPEEELEVNPGGGYPFQHTPDGEPPTINSDGVVSAGSDTGQADLVITHPEYGEVVTRIMIVPPDWCPLGEHVDGGPGDDGFCL